MNHIFILDKHLCLQPSSQSRFGPVKTSLLLSHEESSSKNHHSILDRFFGSCLEDRAAF